MQNDETPIRLQSPILSSCPWSTGTLSRKDIRSTVDEGHEMRPFLESLHQFEKAALSRDLLTQETRRLLKVQFLPTEVTLRPSGDDVGLLEADRRGWMKLASIVLAYRVADIIGFLNGEVQIPKKVQRKKLEKEKLPKGLLKLKDWTSLLETFKSMASKEKPSSVSPGQSNSHLKLIKWLSYYKDTNQSTKVKSNLVAAAIHLAFLRNHSFQSYDVPELTSDVNVLVAAQQKFSESEHSMKSAVEESMLNSKEMELARTVLEPDANANLGDNSRSLNLRNPLHIALGISPLCLLMPLLLMKQRMGRKNLLDIFVSLGNEKPQSLVKVEKIIWNVLFRIAGGALDPDEAIKVLYTSLPWDEIKMCSLEDRKWFSNGNEEEDLTDSCAELKIIEDRPEGALERLSKEVEYLNSTNMTGRVVLQSQGVGDGRPKKVSVDEDDRSVEQGMAIADSHEPTESSQSPSKSPDTPQTDPQQPDTEAEDDGSGEKGTADPEHEELTEPPRSPTRSLRTGSPSKSHDPLPDEDYDMSEETVVLSSRDEDQSMESETVESPSKQNELTDEDYVMDDEVAETVNTSRPRDTRLKSPPRRSNPPRVTSFLPQRTPSKIRLGKRKKSPDSLPSSPKKKKGEDNLVKQPLGSSIDDPIDVDDLQVETSVTLDIGDAPQKYMGKEMIGYGPTGDKFYFTPALHNERDISLLEAFDKAINTFFVNGLPRHVSHSNSSAFYVISEADFKTTSVEDIQVILRNKHILVTGMSTSTLKFDVKGLSSLTSLSAVTDIQDQSIGRRKKKDEYIDNRLRKGTVRSLIYSAERNGKILNALNFPMPEQGMGSFPFSTDSAAWNYIKGTNNCPADQPLPMGDIRWGLAATAGALSWWHIDSNGFATYLDPKAGTKFVIVARRKFDGTGGSVLESFSEIDVYLNKFDSQLPNADRWELEAVILAPGTRLIMRPNTMHAVFSPENCIFEGGHFYAASTLQDTMFAIVHTFINNFHTNAEKSTYGLLLRRIGWFYHKALVQKQLQDDEYDAGHIPSLTEITSVLDLFTFCNLLFLLNVLDFRTYQDAPTASTKHRHLYDINAIPTSERYQMAYARGCSFDILRWFFTEYEITDKATNEPIDGFKEVAMEYLSHQVSTILAYKKKSLNDLGKTKDDSLSQACSRVALEKQIHLCIQNHTDIPALKNLAIGDDEHLKMAFPKRNRYSVRKLEESRSHQSPEDLLKYGTTAADSMLFKFLAKRRAYMGQA